MWKFSPEQCFTQMSGRRASFFWRRSEVGLTASWSLSQNLINEKHITNGKSTENLLAICHSSKRAKDNSSINRGSKRLKNKSIWIKSLNSAFIHLQEQKLPLQCFTFQELEACTIRSLTVSNLQYSSGLLLPITNFFSMNVFSSMKARTVLLEFTVLSSLCVCVWAQLLSHVQLFVTLWTISCQAPLSTGFSRQEYWRGLPFPATRDYPDPEIEPMSPASPALAGGFFTTEPPGKLYSCYLPTKSLANNRSSFRCWMDRWMDAWRRKRNLGENMIRHIGQGHILNKKRTLIPTPPTYLWLSENIRVQEEERKRKYKEKTGKEDGNKKLT